MCFVGDPVTFTNWLPGHTDNFISHDMEDCVALIPYKGGVWDDIPCGGPGFFFGDSGETHLAFCEYSTNGLLIYKYVYLFSYVIHEKIYFYILRIEMEIRVCRNMASFKLNNIR